LLIITALAGAVVARFPAFARTADLETEVRRLELLLGMARNEAILDSSEYGFRTVGNGYEFLKFADGSQAWEKAPAPFHLRELPDDIELILRTEKNAFSIPGESLPPLLILSSGETTPATLEFKFRNNEDARTLESDGYSDFRRAEDE
jgi:hypothetical protein